ncbi:PAS domain S-box protein [Syntrophotalea carbinolica]|nr:PAS domain S-box protein [Syntrophotalea carbinolica]
MYLILEGEDQDPKALQQLLKDHGYTVSLRSGAGPEAAARTETAEENLPLAFLAHFIDGIIVVDVETVGVKYANKAFADMLGYSLEEVHRHKVWDWDAVWSREEIEEMSATRNWPGEHFETRLRCKDGRVLDVAISHKPIFWQGAELVLCVIEDITERKRTERVLHLTQFTVEKTDDQAFWMDPEGRFLYVNEAACTALGYSREELEGMPIWEVDPNVTRENAVDYWLRLKEQGSMRFESLHRAKDGRIYPVEVRGNYVNYDGREYSCVFVTDLSERRQAEQQLRQANLVLESSPAVLYRRKAQPGWPLEMVTRNVACFGYAPNELLSGAVSFADLVHPEDLDRVAAEGTEYTLQGEDRFQQEYRIVTRGGDVRWVDDRTVAERDGQGRVTHYQGIVLDITDRKRTELVMAARMRLIQFAATHTLDELLEATLDEAEDLTDSQIGFFVFLDADQKTLSMQNWSTRTKRDFCTAQGKGLHYPVSQAGVWADCIHQRRPVIHNDYAALLHRKGLPPGHSPLMRELVVPVFRGENIMAVVAVGNKSQTYTPQDVEAVSLLADLAWTIAESKKAEEALENRLVALTRPLEDAAGVTFEELFNLSDIQRLQDDFAQATGVASLITLPDGTPLTEPSNFCRFCTMIRATEKGAVNCIKSDAVLGRPSALGSTVRKCLSGGLWGAGAAILVGGRHIASWLIGQVRDANVTEEQVRACVRKTGVDEEAVLEAFREIPVMPRERFGQVAQALNTLAGQLSSIAYQNVQQARFITDYKQAEEARRKSESEYKSIVEHAPFGITRSTREGKLLSVNPALASILKYDSVQELMETVNRSSIQEVLFPKPEERDALVDKVLTQDAWYVFNNRLRCKDGSIVTCRVHSRRIADEGGLIGEFESFQENITDQLAAQEALRESEEKFRVLAETSPVAICLYQEDRHIYANPAMERLFGYDADTLCNMNIWDIGHEDSRDLIRERGLARLAGQSVSGQYEIKYLTKAGGEGYVLISAGLIEYQGRPTGVASFLDITERKRTEQLIRASLKEKDVLLREIHHRVKNNLQVVSSLLYLQSQKFSDAELQNCFLESQSRICSMAIAHEQLYQSKNLADISIKTYLENLVQQQQQILFSPGQQIDCRLTVEDIPLDIEKVVPCGLLITELLSNAYKHAFADGRSGQVAISLHSHAGQFELTVADNGVGVPADFDYCSPKTLGLQLVTALVNQLNGTLEVESRSGTCFRVRFEG